jgi:anti-sigma regulatory factor (Ser/Thr protein kinase)
LSCDHRELSRLADWLHRFAVEEALSEQTVFRLELVLTEAVTNVMDHACQPDAEVAIDLVCVVEDESIDVQLIDNGPAFDPTARAPTQLPKTLAEARPGGLGIHLMRQYANGMGYRRENGHNILRLILPLRQTTPA